MRRQRPAADHPDPRGRWCRVQPLIRSTPLEGPIATIPFDAIKAFLGKPSIVSKDDLKNAPRVAGLRDRHHGAGAGHDLYVKGMNNLEPGRFSVVRVGESSKDPDPARCWVTWARTPARRAWTMQ